MILNRAYIAVINANIALAAVHHHAVVVYGCNKKGHGRKAARHRVRRTVKDVYNCLGPTYFRRAYRMTYHSFWVLHSKLKQGILDAHKKLKEHDNDVCDLPKIHGRPPPIPNGPISTSVRLACALRYFAGGSPYDIAVNYGIAYTCMIQSVWIVVEATNRLPEFFITYPDSHEEQMKIADGFQKVSTSGFATCAGAIDGILIWTLKPTVVDAKALGIGQKKFLCSRKHKFGLNCQAVSDAHGRFLDISIIYGGSSSDCLAFEKSSLHSRLQDGVLKEGLCLFGDNAYINSMFMATPYSNVKEGSRDNYNFYHSQLRIHVECAFGMLTQRWGILRSPIAKGITISKTICLTHALAKLHNFCIDVKEKKPGRLFARDRATIMNNVGGYVPLERTQAGEQGRPLQLMGGSHHYDDMPRNLRRNQDLPTLPRQKLMMIVVDKHLVRPSAKMRTKNS